MVRIFKTEEGRLQQIQEPADGCWIALTDPTATEIFDIAQKYDIEVDDLRAPLDEEERSRIEAEDNYTLILVDIPTIEERNDRDWYETIPMGIVVTGKVLITVCLEDTPILGSFMDGRVRNFFTYMKTRFILQILYRNANMYLHYLRIIDKKSEQIESQLHRSQRNKELIELLELEKCLVYFTTSLRSNEMVLEKLMKIDSIKHYPEDEDLLEDVIIENKQAIEMADIYSNILRDTTEAVASIINNNRHEIPGYCHAGDLGAEHYLLRLRHECPQREHALRGQSLRLSDSMRHCPGSLSGAGFYYGEKEVFLTVKVSGKRKEENEVFQQAGTQIR